MNKYKNNTKDMLVAESLNHFILSESMEEVFTELGISKDNPEYLEYISTFPDLNAPDYEKKFAEWIVNDDIDAKKIKFIHQKEIQNKIDLDKTIDKFQSFKDYKDYILSKEDEKDKTPKEEAEEKTPLEKEEAKEINQDIEKITDRDSEIVISSAEKEKDESRIFTKILKTGYECLTDIHNSDAMSKPGQGLYIWAYKRDLKNKDNRLKFGEYGSKANVPKTPLDTISGYGAGQFGTVVILYAKRFTDDLIKKFGMAYNAEMQVQKLIQKNKGYRVGKNKRLEGAGIRSREVFGGIELDKMQEIINEVLYEVPKLKNFEMRPEQKAAHDKMVNYYKSGGKEFLLAAKMRYGKNFTLLNTAKTLNFKNILVLTYKPHVFPSLKDDLSNHVNFDGWEIVDYKTERNKISPAGDKPKIFMSSAQLAQYKKSNAEDDENYDLEKTSISDIRKNLEVLKKIDWDFIIADEYHYGTSTVNFMNMLKELKYKHISYVSGTAMKDIETGRFDDRQIFEWSYIDEQRQKKLEKEGKSDSKQHLDMPTMIMHLMRIEPSIIDDIMKYYDEDEGFTMAKMIGTDDQGKLKHPQLLKRLLEQISGEKVHHNMSPYTTEGITGNLDHTLWVLDKNVNGIMGMAEIMESMPEFDDYDIIPATGNVVTSIDEVKERINRNDKTITLTCYRFKEGTSVPEWNGVFMLDSGKSIEEYLQAIFRSQNPDPDNNKENCYVFDFNPQRALTMSYEICENTDKTGKKPVSTTIREYLDYAQILDHRGNTLEKVSTEEIMEAFRSHGSFSEKFANVKNIDIEKIDDQIIESVTDIKAGKRGKTVDVNDNDVELGKNIMQQRSKNDGKDKKVNKNEAKKILQKIATVLSNIPEFLFDTPDKEITVEDILKTDQKDLFEQVTGISVENFKMWFDKGLINPVLMNRNIEHFMESEEKLMNDPSGEKIEKFTKQHFNMRAEEGKTPLPLVKEMLDKLPKNIWKDKNKKFCDPVMGTGTFLLEIKERLMEGLSDKIKNEREREEHILKNMLWGVDIDRSKTLISEKLINNNNLENNLLNEDSLKLNWNDMPNFDVVCGNPPYQNPSKSMSEALWPKFTVKGLNILKEGGYLLFLTSNSWLGGNINNKRSLRHVFKDNKVIWVKWGKKIDNFFKLGISISAFLIKKEAPGTKKETMLENDFGSITVKHNDLDYIPQNISSETLNILEKIESKSNGYIPGYFKEIPGYRKGSKIISSEPDDVFKYKIANTSAQYSKGTYLYASKENPLQRKEKVIFSDSGYARPFYDKGEIGPGHHARSFFIKNKNEAENLIDFLESNIVKFMVKSKTGSGTAVDIGIVANRLPNLDFSKKWSDKELYDYFELTQKEIDFLESQVK